jgi:hypothetical protein
MKQNKNNKIHIALFIVSILSVTMIYQYFKNVQIQEMKNTKQETPKTDDKQTNIVVKANSDLTKDKKIDGPKRDIAATKNPNLILKYKDRALVGNVHIQTDFPIANKINKNWQELATNKLSQFKEVDTTLKITPIKAAIYVKHQIGRYVEHVKISLTKKDGVTSSYEAYVDSQSGAIIETWNQTRFEFRSIASLESKGNEFIAEKIETTPSEPSL